VYDLDPHSNVTRSVTLAGKRLFCYSRRTMQGLALTLLGGFAAHTGAGVRHLSA